jgi:hypothetical protein
MYPSNILLEIYDKIHWLAAKISDGDSSGIFKNDLSGNTKSNIENISPEGW